MVTVIPDLTHSFSQLMLSSFNPHFSTVTKSYSDLFCCRCGVEGCEI